MASSKAKLITSWVLSALPSLMMLGPSAYSKLNPSTEMAEGFAKIGLTTQQMFVIGIVEIAIVLLYLFPRTSFLGAVLVTGYLGGATFVHVRGQEAFIGPIIFGILFWVGLGLRRPEIFRLALGKN